MKFKKSMSLLSLVVVSVLGGCGPTKASDSSTAKGTDTPATDAKQSETVDTGSKETVHEKVSANYDLTEKVTLNMSVFYQSGGETYMKFPETATTKLKQIPYTGADKTTYQGGDFKPVWKALQKNLNFTINDVTSRTDANIKASFGTMTNLNFKSGNDLIHIAQGNSDQIISEGTQHDTILDLSQYLDQMPNFKYFLEENPAVAKIIVDADGKMFYAPYFDGYDDIERMLMVRVDWVKKLLDGDTLPTGLDTSKTVSKHYTPFYTTDVNTTVKTVKADKSGTEEVSKVHTAANNIISIQNNLTKMDGASLVKALRDYIDSTYAGHYGSNRSDLFCSVNAAYDVDELIALYRCVYACPEFLTGDANTTIVPLFPRENTNDRTSDLWRFTQFFGVRGGESRNGFLYVGTDGKIHDTRGEAKFRDALLKLNEMYAEGLILQDFTSKTTGSGKFRDTLLKENTGFSTYDYNQTTTIYNDDPTCSSIDGFTFASIMPAAADWTDDGKLDFTFYTESWRSVKPQGWFITKQTANDEKTLKRALALFDYLYSDEGNTLMSYGPEGYIKTDSNGKVVTMDYQGTQVPVLSDDCKQQLKDLTGGNYTNYYRYYVGATYPVGYIKQQGMEYQTVSAKATSYLDNINTAIQLGVLNHVNHLTGNSDKLNSIIPATFSFSDTEQEALGKDFTVLTENFSQDKGKNSLFSDIVMKGFGTYSNLDLSYDNYLTTMTSKSGANLTSYVSYYNDAYARMEL